LKKQELIKINQYYGYIFKKKKCNRHFLIQNLLPIHRKEVLKKNIISEKEDCPICFLTLNKFNYTITNCGHAFCRECIFLYITKEKENCPLCREPYSYDDFIKPLTPTELELLLYLVSINEKNENETNENEHIITPSVVSYYLYIMNYCKKIFFILLKLFLFIKSVEILYVLIIEDDIYNTSISYYIIRSPTTLDINRVDQCVATY
jgi:hypothetical protein